MNPNHRMPVLVVPDPAGRGDPIMVFAYPRAVNWQGKCQDLAKSQFFAGWFRELGNGAGCGAAWSWEQICPAIPLRSRQRSSSAGPSYCIISLPGRRLEARGLFSD
jgi:hypothetical protein